MARSRVKIKHNKSAYAAIINSRRVANLVDAEAEKIAQTAQSMYLQQGTTAERSDVENGYEQGYRAKTGLHGDYGKPAGRPVAYVHARGWRGQVDQARNRTLEKALSKEGG